MSCFIVEKRTIDRIVAHIASVPIDSRQKFYPLLAEENKNKLGCQLWRMNVDAYNYRYSESSHVPAEPYPIYVFSRISFYTPIQTFKSFECFIYQCSEGDIPKTELYKQVFAVSRQLAAEIVHSTSQYDKAEWA